MTLKHLYKDGRAACGRRGKALTLVTDAVEWVALSQPAPACSACKNTRYSRGLQQATHRYRHLDLLAAVEAAQPRRPGRLAIGGFNDATSGSYYRSSLK